MKLLWTRLLRKDVGIASCAFLLVSALALTASPAQAQQHVGHSTMMNQPGVKLVAVEFWADWCKPCVAAIPRWKKLHKKYRDRGFRLIVVGVNTEGRCSTPGWTPDKIVCDLAGEVADAWNAKDLPQAFLWTWQGALVVEHGTVDEIERRVEQWFRETPRILVEAPLGPDGNPLEDGVSLRKLVRNELRRQARFDLVPDEEEAAELRRLRAEGGTANFDESQACRLGKDISANSALKISTLGNGESRRLLLELFSLERSCLVASAVAPLGAGDSAGESAVIETVSKLLSNLMGEAHKPSTASRSSTVTEIERVQGGDSSAAASGEEKVIRGEGKSVDLGAREYILSVSTSPAGAMVSVDGSPPRSENTRFLLPAGRHDVTALLEWYSKASQTVQLDGNEKITLKLEPNWGTISVNSTPGGATVLVNGQNVGTTPFSRRFQPGGYRVEVTKDLHLTYEKQFNLAKSETQKMAPKLEPSFGTLTVESNPAGANVVVNGMKVGTTPVRGLKLPPGNVTLQILAPKYHPVRFEGFHIERGKNRAIKEHLKPVTGGLKVVVQDASDAPVPARLFLDGMEVGEAPFASEVQVGTYTLKAVSGRNEVSQEVTVAEGKVTSASLRVKGAAPVAALPRVEEVPSNKRSSPSVLPWLFMGTGGASAVLGATLVLLASNEKDSVKSSGTLNQEDAQSRWDAANTMSGWGYVAAGTGGALLIGGIVWKLLEPSAPKATTAFSLVPVDGGFSVGYVGSF